MRLLKAFWIAFLLPATSLAAGYGGADGRNMLGERLSIASDSYYELYVIRGHGDGVWSAPFDMNTECPDFVKAMEKGVGSAFSCPPKRDFPLAGTTYRIKLSKKYRPCNIDPFYDKHPGIIYQCIRGCSKRTAPRVFKEGPWEC